MEGYMQIEYGDYQGYQVGENFGSSLCAPDLNKDGYSDLVVGAPMYSDHDKSLPDTGRVYVYISMVQCLSFCY